MSPAVRSDLHLAELLDFRPDQGIIRLHDQRVVILSERCERRISRARFREGAGPGDPSLRSG